MQYLNRGLEHLHKFHESLVRQAQSTSDFAENVYFFFKDTEANFQAEFEMNRERLERLIGEFCEWVSSTLEAEKVVTVLGL